MSFVQAWLPGLQAGVCCLPFHEVGDATKKDIFFCVPATKKGVGPRKGLSKKNFLEAPKKKEIAQKVWPLSLSGRATKNTFFCGAEKNL